MIPFRASTTSLQRELHMRRHALTFACLGILAMVVAAAPAAFAQTVKADFDKSTDFSKYKTFAFRKGTEAPTPFQQERIESAITAELNKRGIREGEPADLLVYTHTQVRNDERMD